MQNIQLTIAYDGTRYAGWQVQKNSATVQAAIEKVLTSILGEKVRLTASGRTDSGVHAKKQIANFKTKNKLSPNKLHAALAGKLPKDISVIRVKKVPFKYHSQFDAKSKIYRYTILNGKIDDPFRQAYYSKVPYDLDVSLMKKEARFLLGRHNFRSFQAKNASLPRKNTVRTIKKISIKKRGRFIYIDIEANGFLYNMVRNIVGTLIEIGRGYFSSGSMEKMLNSRDRRKTGPTASARGLMLLGVTY